MEYLAYQFLAGQVLFSLAIASACRGWDTGLTRFLTMASLATILYPTALLINVCGTVADCHPGVYVFGFFGIMICGGLLCIALFYRKRCG